MGFIQAYMPKLNLPEPGFSLRRWRRALDNFPCRPARGVHGIDVADLKHLPDNITTSLLTFLAKTDGFEIPWPAQLLYGTVINLAKQEQSHLPSHFRPVVILGMVCRTWSRMNALPLLSIFGQIVPSCAYGFFAWPRMCSILATTPRIHRSLSPTRHRVFWI